MQQIIPFLLTSFMHISIIQYVESVAGFAFQTLNKQKH
jgi:hypothetical protein